MKKNAYTLTELVAVITIIGIVLLITIPVASNMMRKNNEEKCTTYVGLVENALKTYADIEMPSTATESVSINKLINDEYVKSNELLTSLKTTEFKIKKENGIIEIPNVELQFKISGKQVCCNSSSCKDGAC